MKKIQMLNILKWSWINDASLSFNFKKYYI